MDYSNNSLHVTFCDNQIYIYIVLTKMQKQHIFILITLTQFQLASGQPIPNRIQYYKKEM
jgi:hypothetical protein